MLFSKNHPLPLDLLTACLEELPLCWRELEALGALGLGGVRGLAHGLHAGLGHIALSLHVMQLA
ncbi:MAG: hypothetical protein DJ555_01800 [Desulfurococcaceae archaeon]|nr:MAG: hypothetical protein DJ555_01800 [Desulfurococcaceae archaeon]